MNELALRFLILAGATLIGAIAVYLLARRRTGSIPVILQDAPEKPFEPRPLTEQEEAKLESTLPVGSTMIQESVGADGRVHREEVPIIGRKARRAAAKMTRKALRPARRR